MHPRYWRVQEEKLLRKLALCELTLHDAAKYFFPNRTRWSVGNRASELGIKFNGRYKLFSKTSQPGRMNYYAVKPGEEKELPIITRMRNREQIKRVKKAQGYPLKGN